MNAPRIEDCRTLDEALDQCLAFADAALRQRLDAAVLALVERHQALDGSAEVHALIESTLADWQRERVELRATLLDELADVFARRDTLVRENRELRRAIAAAEAATLATASTTKRSGASPKGRVRGSRSRHSSGAPERGRIMFRTPSTGGKRGGAEHLRKGA